ncbi:MAG: cob(I)yrinic acid a,c-diamide adenosyltransferase [Candidatus Taylorbacteria bacterium]|nr:cob(I)yrinic acid a,c-diamide adenosyltransferase [Candidatus Taylorbacteria bacterium]
MLYTRKGDSGTTKTFGCDQRISKSSAIAEVLGALDETNSFLGLCRSKTPEYKFELVGRKFEDILFGVQESLFIIQAELAGVVTKTIPPEKVKEMEGLVDAAEKEMPPIESFFIPGATELGAYFDVARTIARRAERRVVAVAEEGQRPIGEHSKAYMNRLSSLLYALARLSNHRLGAVEKAPTYK